MATIHGNCQRCGAPLKCEIADSLASAALVAALCPACSDQQFLDAGGCILTLRCELEGTRFSLGKITVTAGAVAALAETSEHAVTFLARHVRGDWGAFGQCDQIELNDDELRRGWEATDDTGKINKWDLLHGQDTIMSEYTTARGTRIWVLTRLDRSRGTTVLLPGEY